jgi:hypothetical protein
MASTVPRDWKAPIGARMAASERTHSQGGRCHDGHGWRPLRSCSVPSRPGAAPASAPTRIRAAPPRLDAAPLVDAVLLVTALDGLVTLVLLVIALRSAVRRKRDPEDPRWVREEPPIPWHAKAAALLIVVLRRGPSVDRHGRRPNPP